MSKVLTLTSKDGTKIYADALGNPSNPAIVFVHGVALCADVFDILFAKEILNKNFYLVRLIHSLNHSLSTLLRSRFVTTCAVMVAAVCPKTRKVIRPSNTQRTTRPCAMHFLSKIQYLLDGM